MAPAIVLQLHDAKDGVGAATVDCPRRRIRVPALVCEVCEHCVHASRPEEPDAWVFVCNFAGAA